MRASEQGFLLFELLLVFCLATIIACFVFGNMRFLNRGYARAELQTLYQMCLYAQRRAISSGQECAIQIDVKKHRYACNGMICMLSDGVQFNILPNVKGPPSSPQHHLTQMCTFKNNCITCSSDGIIDAGTIYITDFAKQNLYALTSGVAPYSYLRMYRYAGKWQRLE